jgi:hypothetical protein
MVGVPLGNEEVLVRLKTIPALALCLFAFVRVAVAARPENACKLPEGLEREIAARYPGTELVTLSALDAHDRGFFQKDHGDACPGLTKVDFYGDGKPTLALVLIGKSDTKENAKLVVAHQVEARWQTTVLDTADGAPVPVVWSQPPAEYRDIYGKKQVRATRPVIVFAGYESWAILYSWTGKSATKIWIAD